ncbi:MAG: helix-turn-helix transcriptional regulator [Planctomycetes bacterium]|nr:helix-turn-helix transcriptional regulator [Planctomycetota bacterium]
MPKTAFSKALVAKQRELKLSSSALAKAIGVGVQSVTAALKGTSVPNAATTAKYAAFLGVEVADLQKLLGKSAAKPAKAAKSKKAAPKAKAKKATTTGVDLTKVTIGQVAALLSDDLVLAVYEASAAKRDIIAAILRAD